MNINKYNIELLKEEPVRVVEAILENAKSPVITTNFRPYEVAILHLVTQVRPDISIIWCDSGYNTIETYNHAQELIDTMKLNVDVFTPLQTTAFRNVYMGVPNIESPLHEKFTYEVKLEPFQRAMKQYQPDVWFTNLRKGQTAFRDSIDILSESKDGVLKVAPFYNFSDKDLDKYMEDNNLTTEFNYFDPTKVEENRECGIHI